VLLKKNVKIPKLVIMTNMDVAADLFQLGFPLIWEDFLTFESNIEHWSLSK
jgi:hypothetical protein